MPVFEEYVKADEEEAAIDEEERLTDSGGNTDMGPMMMPPAETLIYFYHPDHLGTATFLTDGNGQLYQFYLNLPFGETMAEQHSLTEDYETPYKFNAKEMDKETGYYYYGARYFDPEISIWLSVDPLAADFPAWNPYNYAVQNPITFLDPDGRKIRNADEERRIKHQTQLDAHQAIVSEIESKYGTRRKDFKSKESYKSYLRAKARLSESKALVSMYTERSKITQERIEEFKSEAPDKFAIMDNMTNECGEEVDVMVGVDNFYNGYWGHTPYGFAVDDVGDVRLKSEFGINTIEVVLPVRVGADDFGYKPSTLRVTKHEMGHANYIIGNTKSFMEYLEGLKKRGTSTNGGHNPGNPSGQRADEWDD